MNHIQSEAILLWTCNQYKPNYSNQQNISILNTDFIYIKQQKHRKSQTYEKQTAVVTVLGMR